MERYACAPPDGAFLYTEYPLRRNGVALHLDRAAAAGAEPKRDILLTHGVTYSSQEFDVDYRDYSLVKCLSRAGFAVWRLDIAGYGRSGRVEDGFAPDSSYAAEDILAAAELIARETGRETLDLLGWSWGTVCAGRFAARHPEWVERLVLYAPILCGIGACAVDEPFHRNTRAHAEEDFQHDASGGLDLSVTDPALAALWCESCLRWDGALSPNGGRREICVDPSVSLIELEAIRAPTLVICGDRDPYLNYPKVLAAPESLPPGSKLELIPGGAHAVMVERPYYRDFQIRLLRFLTEGRE